MELGESMKTAPRQSEIPPSAEATTRHLIDRSREKEYRTFVSSSEWYRSTNQHLIDLLPPLRDGSTIVDAGCGSGDPTRMLAETYPQSSVIGVDNSDQMLEEARSAHGNSPITFRKGDVLQLLSIVSHADAVVGFNMVHYLSSDGERRQFLKEIAKVLLPEGALALNTGFFGGAKSPGTEIFYRDFAAAIYETARARGVDMLRMKLSLKRKDPMPGTYDALLQETGFSHITTETIEQQIPLQSLRAFFRTDEVAKSILPEIEIKTAQSILAQTIDSMTRNYNDSTTFPRRWLYITAEKGKV